MAEYNNQHILSRSQVKNGIESVTELTIYSYNNKTNGTVTLGIKARHYVTNGFMKVPSGKGIITVNGVDYSFNFTNLNLLKKVTSQDLGSITTEPIELLCIGDEKQRIDISFNFKCSIDWVHYYENEDDTAQTVGSTALVLSDFFFLNAVHEPTNIVVTGTTITEVSKLDLKNNRTHANATHSLSYSCGKVKDVVLFTEASGDYLTFTLPDSLAAQSTNSNDLLVTFTLTTHFPFGAVGSKTSTVIFKIPDKDVFFPSCTVEVTDAEYLNHVQLAERYGQYVQNKSRFHVKVTPILAFGSEIATCTVKANDETLVGYLETSTGKLKHSGINTITVIIQDKRGRSYEETLTANVIEYAVPYVSELRLDRCDRTGVEDDEGGYIKVTFSAEITPLNGINSASYKLKYQTSAGLDQTDVNLTDYAGQYSVVDGTYIFEADSGTTYSVIVTATDDLDSGFRHKGADESITIWNALESGDGFAFGTIATLKNVLETMFQFYPHKGFMFPEFEGSTIHSVRTTPNVYTVKSGQDVDKSPVDGEYTLIVLPGGGTGDMIFIAISNEPKIYIKVLANSSWGSWKSLTLT